MKLSFTTAILLLNLLHVVGQNMQDRVFLETKKKSELFYVELFSSGGTIYEMGRYFDKAGTGYSILSIDSLVRQSDRHYSGRKSELFTEKNQIILSIGGKKSKRYFLDTTTNLTKIYTNLNNAYFLDKFFFMTGELNQLFPLNHYSFRNGFYTWENLLPKEMELEHNRFKVFANIRIQKTKDSICLIQNQYVSLTNMLVLKLNEIGYETLKDSLIKLPIEFKGTSWYFGRVVNEISKQNPEFYFRLAEDFPKNRSIIFGAVEDTKDVINSLEKVKGHDEIKAEFIKDRRFGKTMLYRVLGTNAIIGGLLVWLIVSQ